MRIAYLECFSGISGDMFLGALVDAGVPGALLEETVAALNLGARLEISRVDRSGISAAKVDVYARGEKDKPREQAHHDHHHDHEDGHRHSLHIRIPRRVIGSRGSRGSRSETERDRPPSCHMSGRE